MLYFSVIWVGNLHHNTIYNTYPCERWGNNTGSCSQSKIPLSSFPDTPFSMARIELAECVQRVWLSLAGVGFHIVSKVALLLLQPDICGLSHCCEVNWNYMLTGTQWLGRGGRGHFWPKFFLSIFCFVSVVHTYILQEKYVWQHICREKLQNLGPKSHQKGHFTL